MIAYEPLIQKLDATLFDEQQLSVNVLRLDLLHAEISGNKWFKLKHNLDKAKAGNFKTIITFGGAFSNHITATAAACKIADLMSIGIIRGEEAEALNPTLIKAKENGMQLHFISRDAYKQKENAQFKKYLSEQFGEHYLIPEGGNNAEGVLGCAAILKPDWHHDYIFCACGTGTTFAGILSSLRPSQVLVGISVLKGENQLPAETKILLDSVFPGNDLSIAGNEALENSTIKSSCITNQYCFKGYAKYDEALAAFKNKFELDFKIPLDHIYTTKLFYAFFDLVHGHKLRRGTKILLIHSGGLQGNAGFEARYKL